MVYSPDGTDLLGGPPPDYEVKGYRNPKMIVRAPWRDEFRDIITRERICRLYLESGCSNPEKEPLDLAFLDDLSELWELSISACRLKDFSPVERLSNLQRLAISYCDNRGLPDFNAFKKLQDCCIDWKPKAESLFSCDTLKNLRISRYPFEGFEQLARLVRLEYLHLRSQKLASLHGMGGLARLRALELAYCPKLTSIAGIENLPELEAVELYCCKRVDVLPSLSGTRTLRKLVIENSGTFESVRPVLGNQTLEALFAIDTYFADDDLTPLLSLPNLKKVALAQKRGYAPPPDEIKEQVMKRLKERENG